MRTSKGDRMWQPWDEGGAERTCGSQAKRSQSPLSTNERPASSQWTKWTEQRRASRGGLEFGRTDPVPLECTFCGDGHSFTSALEWGWHTVGTQISVEEVSAR